MVSTHRDWCDGYAAQGRPGADWKWSVAARLEANRLHWLHCRQDAASDVQEIPAGLPRRSRRRGDVAEQIGGARRALRLGRVGATWVLFPIQGGDGRPVPLLTPGKTRHLNGAMAAETWAAVARADGARQAAADVFRVELAGDRTLCKTLTPSDPVGVEDMRETVMTPDEQPCTDIPTSGVLAICSQSMGLSEAADDGIGHDVQVRFGPFVLDSESRGNCLATAASCPVPQGVRVAEHPGGRQAKSDIESRAAGAVVAGDIRGREEPRQSGERDSVLPSVTIPPIRDHPDRAPFWGTRFGKRSTARRRCGRWGRRGSVFSHQVGVGSSDARRG